MEFTIINLFGICLVVFFFKENESIFQVIYCVLCVCVLLLLILKFGNFGDNIFMTINSNC